MDSEINLNKSKEVDYNFNVKDDETVSDCPICFEPLLKKDDDNRTLVKLRCNHQFHLDCIGSAFNAKKKMQCPICRNIEQGQWLYPTDTQTHRSPRIRENLRRILRSYANLVYNAALANAALANAPVADAPITNPDLGGTLVTNTGDSNDEMERRDSNDAGESDRN